MPGAIRKQVHPPSIAFAFRTGLLWSLGCFLNVAYKGLIGQNVIDLIFFFFVF